MSLSAGSPSWRVRLALALPVLALHAALLWNSPGAFGIKVDNGERPRAFTTRQIEAPPEPEAAPPPAPVARAEPKPAPRPAAPAPAPAPTEPGPETAAPSLPAETPTLAETEAPATPSVAVASEPAAATASVAAPSPSEPAVTGTTRVTAVGLPGSVRLTYAMTGTSKGLNYQADAELQWSNLGERYEAMMEVSAFLLGSRSMTSSGQIGAGGLAPERFLDKSRSEQAAHFQRDQGKVTFSANTPDAPWIEGGQDRVSVFFQLGAMLAGNPGMFPPGSNITLYTVGPRSAENWTFVVGEEEKMVLPRGETTVIKLTRRPRRELDQTVEIWYAPSLEYLPVRNRITQANGDSVDQRLKAVIRP